MELSLSKMLFRFGVFCFLGMLEEIAWTVLNDNEPDNLIMAIADFP